jgi:type II secretory ATPase GspE/PulE/Tfp pilus assembly ATPase PilB-like protein
MSRSDPRATVLDPIDVSTSLETLVPGAVTIAHLDGRQRRGRLARFSPAMADIALEAETPPSPAPDKDKEKPKHAVLRAEDIAYIAFHRGPETLPASEANLELYKIHVAGGEQLLVRTAAKMPVGVGFLALPVSAEGPYAAFFFYRHGVNAREKEAPIGTLLVTSGRLDRHSLAQGLAAQSAARSAPIGQILVELKKIDKETVDEAAELQKRKRLRIGEVLREAGLISAQDIEQALTEQRKRKGKRLGEVLVELGLLQERDLVLTLADKFDLPFVNLDEVAVNPEALAAVGPAIIAKYTLLPLDIDAKMLTIAISDPTSVDAIDVLRVRTQRRVREVVVVPSQLKRHVEAYLAQQKASAAAAVKPAMTMEALLQDLAKSELQAGVESEDDDQIVAPRADEGGIIRLVNQIIADAYLRGASDVHVEPNGKHTPVMVRFRIDGECVLYQELPPIVRNALVSAIKIMAKLDISERRRPQDGKIRFRLSDRLIELRVASIPSVNGNEDVVLRVLADAKPMPLSNIGLSPRNLKDMLAMLRQPYGLILCVGPTGAGKTTTLHSALGHLNDVGTKIWTAEDPVEITQPGLRQVQVSSKIGLTFAAAMRAFLRADPDVIMVGEMRDPETAATAIEASLTGHLVLSTLHTNSAPETLTRLLDMGLDPFTFSDALLGVLAQRLTRALCKQCRAAEPGSEAEYRELAEAYGEDLLRSELGVQYGPDFKLYRAVGCAACAQTGYKGRIGLHELLVSSEEIRRSIAGKSTVEKLRAQAIELGMRTLIQDGIRKVIAGETDLKQVLAVCTKISV